MPVAIENNKLLGTFLSMKANISVTRLSSHSNDNMEMTSSTDDTSDSNTTQ